MRSLIVAAAALALVACSHDTIILPTSPTAVSTTAPGFPTPAPGSPVVTSARIEFRVLGTATSALVRMSTPLDGLTQVTTTLPYNSGFTTSASSLFLSLEGTPQSYSFTGGAPFFAVQIIVNGVLFREATASDFMLNTLSVNGTWRP
jgi:hypothetical protein